MSKSIKKTVRVVIEKEIEVEIMPSMFGSMTEEQFIADWRRCLWEIEDMNEIITHAATMAACYGSGMEHDGLGLVGYHHMTYPRVPDVKFREISEDIEAEILAEEC